MRDGYHFERRTSHFYTDGYRCRLRRLSVQKWGVGSWKFFALALRPRSAFFVCLTGEVPTNAPEILALVQPISPRHFGPEVESQMPNGESASLEAPANTRGQACVVATAMCPNVSLRELEAHPCCSRRRDRRRTPACRRIPAASSRESGRTRDQERASPTHVCSSCGARRLLPAGGCREMSTRADAGKTLCRGLTRAGGTPRSTIAPNE